MLPRSTPHEIEITIEPDGKITSTVNGVEGPSCSELTKWLEELGVVEVDLPTVDYRKFPRQGVVIRR